MPILNLIPNSKCLLNCAPVLLRRLGDCLLLGRSLLGERGGEDCVDVSRRLEGGDAEDGGGRRGGGRLLTGFGLVRLGAARRVSRRLEREMALQYHDD